MKKLRALFSMLVIVLGIESVTAQDGDNRNVYWGFRMGYDCSMPNKALPGFSKTSPFHSMTLSNVIGIRLNVEPFEFMAGEPYSAMPKIAEAFKDTYLELGIKARNICFDAQNDDPYMVENVSRMPAWYCISFPINILTRIEVGKDVYISPFVGVSPKLNVATHSDDKAYGWETRTFQWAAQAGIKINTNGLDFTLQYGRDLSRLLRHSSVRMNDIEITIGANW